MQLVIKNMLVRCEKKFISVLIRGRHFGLKRNFSYLYGGHLENLSYMQLLFSIIGFLDREINVVDIKIVFLSGL